VINLVAKQGITMVDGDQRRADNEHIFHGVPDCGRVTCDSQSVFHALSPCNENYAARGGQYQV